MRVTAEPLLNFSSRDAAAFAETREFPGIEDTLARLIAYGETHRWQGFDPYDALNSRWLTTMPFLNRLPVRLGLTQLVKRSPVNLRGLLRISPTENPKTLALLMSAFVKLASLHWPSADENVVRLAERIEALTSQAPAEYGWGYSFPWQTRTVLVPRGAPNLVCTAFVANALLDAYELTGTNKYLQMAAPAVAYVKDRLYWEADSTAGFAYPVPSARIPVHNANLLGAALLARAARHRGKIDWLYCALKAAHSSVTRQNPDGSWFYGEAPNQRWIDHFHTGYNLWALRTIAKNVPTDEFDPAIQRGFEFYRTHFFTPDGVARYYHNRTYPIDIHCITQALLTLTEFGPAHEPSRRMASQVYRWAMNHLWDEDGFFYYRKLRAWTIRTPFMRWSQAWMILALATILKALRETPARN